MSGTDARFEDGADAAPLRLRAFDADDLAVISALVQDAVLTVGDIRHDRRARRLGLLVNRFRWERADPRRLTAERVRAVLSIEDAMRVQVAGFGREDPGMVLSVLSVAFEPGADGTGRVVLTLAGDGAIAVDVEALEVVLRDVTRPYAAPSGKVPGHPD